MVQIHERQRMYHLLNPTNNIKHDRLLCSTFIRSTLTLENATNKWQISSRESNISAIMFFFSLHSFHFICFCYDIIPIIEKSPSLVTRNIELNILEVWQVNLFGIVPVTSSWVAFQDLTDPSEFTGAMFEMHRWSTEEDPQNFSHP